MNKENINMENVSSDFSKIIGNFNAFAIPYDLIKKEGEPIGYCNG